MTNEQNKTVNEITSALARGNFGWKDSQHILPNGGLTATVLNEFNDGTFAVITNAKHLQAKIRELIENEPELLWPNGKFESAAELKEKE